MKFKKDKEEDTEQVQRNTSEEEGGDFQPQDTRIKLTSEQTAQDFILKAISALHSDSNATSSKNMAATHLEAALKSLEGHDNEVEQGNTAADKEAGQKRDIQNSLAAKARSIKVQEVSNPDMSRFGKAKKADAETDVEAKH